MARYTIDDINDQTGFAAGEKFGNDAEVRAYFRREELLAMAPNADADIPSQDVLDEMAEEVIRQRWHMHD
jgi:hypothetical protein